MNSFITQAKAFSRCDPITSLYQAFSRLYGYVDIYSFYSLSIENCEELSTTVFLNNTCATTWWENRNLLGQVNANNPTRAMLSCLLEQNERKVANYLGYWPGPHLIENENHRYLNWGDTLKLDYSKVIRAGKPVLTQIDLPIVVSQVSSVNTSYSDILQIEIGNVDNPFTGTDCNLHIYPEGYADMPEWRLRPYEVISNVAGVLTLHIPLHVAVKPEEYFVYPDEQGRLKRLSFCNEAIYVDTVAVYRLSYTMPHGFARLDQNCECECYCTCNLHLETVEVIDEETGEPVEVEQEMECTACRLNQVPICLKPVSWERGHFTAHPVVNTAEEGEEACWEFDESYLDCSCYSKHHCQPIDVDVNYVSSCAGSWFQECMPDEPCDNLLEPIMLMTIADLPPSCECGCLDLEISRLQEDIGVLYSDARVPLISRIDLTLGTRRGDLEAYKYLMAYAPRKMPTIAILE